MCYDYVEEYYRFLYMADNILIKEKGGNMSFKIIQRGNEHTNSSSRDKNIPIAIAEHITGNTAKSADNWFRSQNNNVSSANFMVTKKGEIYQYVDIKRMSWCTGLTSGIKYASSKLVHEKYPINPNKYTVSIEHESTDGILTDVQLKATLWLHGEIKRQVKQIYGHDLVFDRKHLIGHFEVDSKRKWYCPCNMNDKVLKFPFDKIIQQLNKGENMSERVNVKIKMSGKIIEDCEKLTVRRLSEYIDPYDEIVKDEPKDTKFYTTPEHHRGKYYNVPIPQITFKKKLYIKDGRSFKDPVVGYVQRALQMFNLYSGIDDWYGKNTHKGVTELRNRLGLPHEDYLTESDIHKFNRAIIDNIHLWVDTDNDIMLWYSKSNNDYMGVITKLRPQDMDFTIQDKSAKDYNNVENAMTSSFQWYESSKRKMHKYGVCRDKNGKNISMYPGQVHGKPCMVIYSKDGGGFGIDNSVLYDSELPTKTGFCENGWEMYPDLNAWKKSGFVGNYSDVTRDCERVVYIQLYGELYGGVYADLGKSNSYRMGKDMYLGCIFSVDGGGSTYLKLTWVRKGRKITKVFYTTTRRLYQMATW